MLGLAIKQDTSSNQNMNMQCIIMLRHQITDTILVCATATAIIGVLEGCSDQISSADVTFVAAMMPAGFESLRMYGEPPERVISVGGYVHPSGGLRQGCEAIIRSSSGPVHEAVILESASAKSFDLDAVRKPTGWDVTSDNFAPTSANTVEFRSQFTSCVSALEDKYQSDPEKIG